MVVLTAFVNSTVFHHSGLLLSGKIVASWASDKTLELVFNYLQVLFYIFSSDLGSNWY